ncbi:MAG: hypothetical protein ACFBSF_03715 [Leptolyngbyaceae cyanobacterium]
MTILEAIERAIEQLSPRELEAFRCWFAEFEVRASAADKLDQFATEALRIKGKLVHFSPEALADVGRWLTEFEAQTSTDTLNPFAMEALRIKGK